MPLEAWQLERREEISVFLARCLLRDARRAFFEGPFPELLDGFAYVAAECCFERAGTLRAAAREYALWLVRTSKP